MPERQTPENCTCLAKLAENARFCHLCGRPVFDDEMPEIPETRRLVPDQPQILPRLSAVSRSAPVPVGFGNPIALRVSVLVSLATMLMEMIEGAGAPALVVCGLIFWGLAGGWVGVLLYRRFTGYALSVGAGAHLGFITGTLTFLSAMVIGALALTTMGADVFQQAVQRNPDAAQMLNDPAVRTGAILMAVLMLFGIMVGACAVGGAIGARFGSRNSANNRA